MRRLIAGSAAARRQFGDDGAAMRPTAQRRRASEPATSGQRLANGPRQSRWST
jgi:hypothetical protein